MITDNNNHETHEMNLQDCFIRNLCIKMSNHITHVCHVFNLNCTHTTAFRMGQLAECCMFQLWKHQRTASVDGGISLNIIRRLPMFENSKTGDSSYSVNIYFLPAETNTHHMDEQMLSYLKLVHAISWLRTVRNKLNPGLQCINKGSHKFTTRRLPTE